MIRSIVGTQKCLWSSLATLGVLLFYVPALAQYSVTLTTDTGAVGELRWAVAMAEGDGVPSTIDFVGFPTPGVITLNPANGPLVLVNESQTWIQGPGPTLVGIDAGGSAQAFVIRSSGNCISELAIWNASVEEILIDGTTPFTPQTNWIWGCWLGLDIVGGPLGTNQRGVRITGLGATYNLIGTDGVPAGPGPGGTPGLNGEVGPPPIPLSSGGPTDAAERNVISNHTSGQGCGVYIDLEASENRVAGNYIGTDTLGLVSLPNNYGVMIDTASYLNCIGLSDASASLNYLGGGETDEGNLISGNLQDGVLIDASFSNWVSGNLIGTDVTGITPLGNGSHGVYITAGSAENIVGTDGDASADLVPGSITGGELNVICANTFDGVLVDASSTLNEVAGNYIGVDLTGEVVLGNGVNGVEFDTAPQNVCGTDADGIQDSIEGNVITGNATNGVFIATDQILVLGNIIGLSASEASIGGNGASGVFISGGQANFVGYLLTGPPWLPNPVTPSVDMRNVMSENTLYGARLSGSTCQFNSLQANWIGTDSSGTTNHGNTQDGVLVENGAHDNAIGSAITIGSVPPNVIRYNGANGVRVDDFTATGAVQNQIRENSINSNTLLGIENINGGNTEEVPPIITAVNYAGGSASGTTVAEDSSTVELFADDADEGLTFLDSVQVNGGTWTINAISWPSLPFNLTATVTDTSNNTSEFSAPNAVTTIADWQMLDD